ncbi:YdcH family protein [Actibacterium sp.]|uniref:YdcH family protein n=1 Tax=Actibacterium sp. TaxID=1872125 RepID=UPI003568EC47
MSHTPHELAEEFPDQVDAIHSLKTSDSHFAKLVDEYHEVNRAIHRAETNVEPTDELHETEMRKQRMALKDQIGRALSAAAKAD